MKKFLSWLQEDAPTNCISGAIRGLGNVTGDPNGVTSYAAANQSDAIANGNQLGDILKMHQDAHAQMASRAASEMSKFF